MTASRNLIIALNTGLSRGLWSLWTAYRHAIHL